MNARRLLETASLAYAHTRKAERMTAPIARRAGQAIHMGFAPGTARATGRPVWRNRHPSNSGVDRGSAPIGREAWDSPFPHPCPVSAAG